MDKVLAVVQASSATVSIDINAEEHLCPDCGGKGLWNCEHRLANKLRQWEVARRCEQMYCTECHAFGASEHHWKHVRQQIIIDPATLDIKKPAVFASHEDAGQYILAYVDQASR